MVRVEAIGNGVVAPVLGDCGDQLRRILDSPDFDATAREHRFLSYVVKEALAGRGGRIKAYSIAIEVFGRDASFDPQSDPIVRVEAGHLRRALERYYLTAGKADPILISIPKGGYVPTFSLRDEALGSEHDEPPAAAEVATWRRALRHKSWIITAAVMLVAAVVGAVWWSTSLRPKPSGPRVPQLLVEWFENLGGTAESEALARGLTQDVIGHLSKFKDIVVVQAQDPGLRTDVRYVLAGSVELSAGTFRFRVRMSSRTDGSVLWAHSYGGTTAVSDLLKAEADVARNVATSLAQAYGVIFEADAKRVVPNPPDDWAAYSCMLSYYSYRIKFDPAARVQVRSCLEKAVKRFPAYATAWALLSQLYIDEVRFTYPFDPVTSRSLIDRALAAASRAVELEPLNIRGLQSQMYALYFRREIDAALRVGALALTINPNDTELMGEYGYRLALSGNWKDGCALVSEARERNPGPLAYYEVGLAMCSYFRGNYPQAVMWIRKADVPTNGLYQLIAAAIFAEAGYEAAEQKRAWLLAHEPALVKNARQEALLRFGRSEDAERFLASLRKAGLEFDDRR